MSFHLALTGPHVGENLLKLALQGKEHTKVVPQDTSVPRLGSVLCSTRGFEHFAITELVLMEWKLIKLPHASMCLMYLGIRGVHCSHVKPTGSPGRTKSFGDLVLE